MRLSEKSDAISEIKGTGASSVPAAGFVGDIEEEERAYVMMSVFSFSSSGHVHDSRERICKHLVNVIVLYVVVSVDRSSSKSERHHTHS